MERAPSPDPSSAFHPHPHHDHRPPSTPIYTITPCTAYSDHDLGYTPNGGSLDLREEIAQLYGPAITADHVLVFPGAQSALEIAAAALAGDAHAIVFTPGYQSVLEAPVHAGARVTRIPLSAATNWDIDIADVEAAICDDTKYMVVNQPWNPAGRLMAPELQRSVDDRNASPASPAGRCGGVGH